MKIKKIISLLLILNIFFILTGCNNTDTLSSETNDTSTNSSEIFSNTHSEVEDMTFEECLSAATHVIEATYTGKFETHGIYQDLLFSSKTQYKGEDLAEDFYVRISHQTESNFSFTNGTTYLLALEKHVSVYLPYDVYLPLGNMIDNNDITYVTDYLLENPTAPSAIGTDYIRSSSLTDIVHRSIYIFKITPTELLGGSDNNHTEQYLCKVDEVLKGTLSEESIEAIFFEDTVDIGSQYIVMLNRNGTSTFCSLSSKNSVYSIDDVEVYQQIQDILNAK